jgi:hypothetical protein
VDQGHARGLRGRDPRKPGAQGIVAEQRERQQELGSALEATVRAVLQRDQLREGMARRCHEILLQQPETALEWHATELRRDGRMVLQAAQDSGRFIYPAYVAGLRGLAVRAQSVAADVLRLAEELAALQTGERLLVDFHDWLWRSGAHGFDVMLVDPLSTSGEALVGAFDEAQFWAGRSSAAIEAWNESALAAGQVCSAAELRARFAEPLDRFARAIATGELSLELEDARALRNAFDDARLWAPAEVGLLLQEPALRSALSPSHLGFLAGSWIEGARSIDPRMLDVADELGVRNADARALGIAIARHVIARDCDPESLLTIVDRAGNDLRSGLVNELAQEKTDPARAHPPLLKLLQHVGRARFFELLDLPAMTPLLLGAVLRAVMDDRADTGLLVGWLSRVPPDHALRAVIAEPSLLSVASALVTQLIAAQPLSSGPLLVSLVEASPKCARCVGNALVGRRCDGFAPDVIAPALVALRERGLGEDFVLPLWLTPAVAPRVRVAALFTLEPDPGLRARAFARKPETSDAIEVREAFEELQWKGHA